MGFGNAWPAMRARTDVMPHRVSPEKRMRYVSFGFRRGISSAILLLELLSGKRRSDDTTSHLPSYPNLFLRGAIRMFTPNTRKERPQKRDNHVEIHSQVQVVHQRDLKHAHHDPRYLLGFFLVSSSFSWRMSTLLG